MFLNENKKRKSYTAKFKLDVIHDYETMDENGSHKLKVEVAAKYSITLKMLRFCYSKNRI